MALGIEDVKTMALVEMNDIYVWGTRYIQIAFDEAFDEIKQEEHKGKVDFEDATDIVWEKRNRLLQRFEHLIETRKDDFIKGVIKNELPTMSIL